MNTLEGKRPHDFGNCPLGILSAHTEVCDAATLGNQFESGTGHLPADLGQRAMAAGLTTVSPEALAVIKGANRTKTHAVLPGLNLHVSEGYLEGLFRDNQPQSWTSSSHYLG